MLNLGTALDAQPAANTAATVTLAAVANSAGGEGRRWSIGGIAWSYDATPSGGSISITNGGTKAFDLDITSAGPGSITFGEPLKADPNAAVVVTLAAGGAGVTGKLVVLGAKLVG